MNLQCASGVGLAEFPWTPGDLCQCEDRIHRIGQKDSVTVYYFCAEGTIDSYIVQTLINKNANITRLVEGIDNSQLFEGNDNILEELLRELFI